MIPLPGGSSPFLFLPSKLGHPASQPVHSPPPTTPPAVVQTGDTPPQTGDTPPRSSHAKTRRREEKRSGRRRGGQIRPVTARNDGEWGHTTLQSRHPTPHWRSIPFNRYIPFNRHTSKPWTHHRVRLTRRREDAKRNAVVFGTGDKSAGDGP